MNNMGFIKKNKRIVIIILEVFSEVYHSIIGFIEKRTVNNRKVTHIKIRSLSKTNHTPVDLYWEDHTVNSKPFKSCYQSKKYLEWRFKVYPLFKELMQLYGNYDDQVILDYGCGPGNDLVGFALFTNAKKIIGIDVSGKALNLSKHRLELHRVDPNRIELVNISDSNPSIPFQDNSIDYIYCEGVLQHTSNPASILKEFFRTLKNGGYANIMVYNSNSIWLHLYTAYENMILQNKFSGMTVNEAFSKNTDGEECPRSRCYNDKEFSLLCNEIGFITEYIGGYFSVAELESLGKYREAALQDSILADEHKEFIKSLVYDKRGYPMYKSKYAGIGGVYRLYKNEKNLNHKFYRPEKRSEG